MSQLMAAAATGVKKPLALDAVRRARAGDEAAFEWIVQTYGRDMAEVCFVVCGDSGLAEEAVAAAWPLAWRRLDTLRDTDRLGSWLISIAANQARQMARSRRRRAVREIPVASIDEPTTSADRDADIDLANALAGLKPDDRALLALRYVAGFDSTELARATGLSPSGTRARLARLLERMRVELADV